MAKKALSHRDLDVYKRAFDAAMLIFAATKSFPKEERYALVDQIRRSSRSICANLAEAWWKRRYELAFVSKLSDAQAEAAETQVWLEFAVQCGYLERVAARALYRTYNSILRTLVGMANHPETWLLPNKSTKRTK
jgi:four helix bundle protein